MSSALEQIVNTVLNEGYPYRASSKKNQRERFTFGRVYPREYSEKENGNEACAMQTECLLRTSAWNDRLEITFRFLQPALRNIAPIGKAPGQDAKIEHIQFQEVPRLKVVERRVSIGVRDFSQSSIISFIFPVIESRETVRTEEGQINGAVMRRPEFLEGRIEARFTELEKDLFRVCVRVINLSAIDPADLDIPQQVFLRTFASSHFTLELENGEFISLLETPAEFKAHAQECKNIGCWPVLAGDKAANECRTMLASPIILYDYPEIAVESAGEFFDGTEIDEMLALRLLTMSDEEKKEIQMD